MYKVYTCTVRISAGVGTYYLSILNGVHSTYGYKSRRAASGLVLVLVNFPNQGSMRKCKSRVFLEVTPICRGQTFHLTNEVNLMGSLLL